MTGILVLADASSCRYVAAVGIAVVVPCPWCSDNAIGHTVVLGDGRMMRSDRLLAWLVGLIGVNVFLLITAANSCVG